MPCNVVIGQTFLPLESVKLGRFVLNLREPHQDYLDPFCEFQAEVIGKTHLRHEEAQQNSTDKSFVAALTRLAAISRSKRNKTHNKITTDKVTTYQLDNSGSWFKNTVRAEATQRWINEAIHQGHDIYLVVGYHTMVDAQIIEGIFAAEESSARLELPVTVPLAAVGAVSSTSNMADPSVAGHSQGDQCVQRRFVATGEQIIAVQYRKVCFKWFSSRDLDSAGLEKDNRWEYFYRNKHKTNRGETKDVLEADLRDELGWEDYCEGDTLETEGIFLF